jgi:D-glycero-D-manno-heptose 1,7-bisphosphate phosphatase
VVRNRAVFFDRDGVLNHAVVRNGKPYPPKDLGDFIIYDDALNCTTQLKENGFYIFVVTNQPDVKSGIQSLETMRAMNAMLQRAMPIDHIEVCFDKDSGFYKPEPGMLIATAQNFGVDLKASYMVGDRWRDIGAGIKAGCAKSIFIDRGYKEHLSYVPDYTCKTLSEVANYILNDYKGIKN